MRKKVLAIILSAALILTLLPATALAADKYNDHDVAAMVAFLNQYSADSVQTNAQVLGCDVNDPSKWNTVGVFWQQDPETSEYYIDALHLSGKTLAGSLNLSDCKYLTALECYDNSLTSINVSNCPDLTDITAYNNPLTTLDMIDSKALTKLEVYGSQLSSINVSGCLALTEIDCKECAIETLNLTGCSALTEIHCDRNKLTSLQVGDSTLLTYLNCSGNRLTGIDLSHNTGLTNLDCSSNKLTSLDLSHNNSLSQLICMDNALTSLNLSGAASLTMVMCDRNKLTTLDVSASSNLMLLMCTDNPLTSVKANNAGHSVSLKADGNGYVNYYLVPDMGGMFTEGFYASAAANSPAVFYNWTRGGVSVGTGEKYDLANGADYDLTAHFLSLSSSQPGSGTYVGGQITLTPTIPGGAWTFNGSYFTRKGNTFTALKAGSSTVTYTLNGKRTSITVTISGSHKVNPVGISCTKTNVTKYGGSDGSITVKASGGNSGAYQYSINNGAAWQTSAKFTGLKAGKYTARARDAKNTANVSPAVTVTISQPNPTAYFANKLPAKASAGTVWLIKPAAPPKGYKLKSVSFASGTKSVATANASGIVKFLKGGKVKLTVKMVYYKGTKTKTVKIVKQITVNQKITAITLNKTTAGLKINKTLKLKPKFYPVSATNKRVQWKSSNSKVATVSSAGVVKGKAKGTAVITCTAKDGSKVSAKCKVTVK